MAISANGAVLGKFVIHRADHCINCGQCADACIYNVHRREVGDVRRMLEPVSDLCRNCFRCIYECPEHALTMEINPAFLALRGITTPEIIQSIWQQAETGRIPVTGQGYRGPFTGPGFDAMWTDMSEIVRPTRDGIHGREFSSTTVDLGGAPERIVFGPEGAATAADGPLAQIEIPMILSELSFGRTPAVRAAMLEVARTAGTMLLLPDSDVGTDLDAHRSSIIIRADTIQAADRAAGRGFGGVEIPIGLQAASDLPALRQDHPSTLFILRARLEAGVAAQVERAVECGIGCVHVEATIDGCEWTTGRQLKDALLALHRHLVSKSIRDRITIIASGGVIAAEHVPKAIICGADAVTLDTALLAALGSDLCERCQQDLPCARSVTQADSQQAVRRLGNLLHAYRDQLLEVMGAMGLREVRRLRGETGRAIFYEDAEKEFVAALGRTVEGPRIVPLVNEPAPPPLAASKSLPFHTIPHKWIVQRSDACKGCGVCVASCPYEVHEWKTGYRKPENPVSHRCIGPECKTNDFFCVANCPESALAVKPDPQWAALGDFRWTADLLVSTWQQAERGEPVANGLNDRTGNSGGGFDRLDFVSDRSAPRPREISTAIPLNLRRKSPAITIPIPIYGGGMSYGSVGTQTMLARARAAKAWSTFVSTGEGGYPEDLYPYDEWIITQIATGLFGVREDTIRRVRIVEFKYAQGAKPGLGGHLLADKNSPRVAEMREAPAATSLFSPFPFHSVYSVEDHKKHVDWVRATNPNCLVSVKVSTPADVDMVAVGSYYAGADIIHLDGGYGGTGAAPDIAKKNIAMPIEYAIPKVHQYLVAEGIRDEVVLMASGGLRTAYDVAKAIALGADGCVVGTSELVAISCNRCGNCESGQGCPSGIATTDPNLSKLIDPDWGAERIINMYHAWRKQWIELLAGFGMSSIRELRGRTDLLHHIPAVEAHEEAMVVEAGR
ncbi:MAG: alpha-hydroxy-acid oxidizing protein [Acidobacteria bacterium]|nr:alpha-hydroxy-acid oxidizing protein [Acidobacteriota bacterium]